MKIGVHVSIRNGFLAAARTAHRIGAQAYQYFPKNPRSLSFKWPDLNDARAANAFCHQHGIESVAHAPYPTNPAVHDLARREMVVQSLLNDLIIAEACGSIGVVVHFGYHHTTVDRLQGYKYMIRCLNHVLAQWDGKAQLLIENEAGGHGPMGTRIEELTQIRNLVERPEQIGFCFDTCHAFQSGEWPHSLEAFPAWEKRLRSSGFLEHLKVVHVNDSVYPYAARKDRHANIGSGQIEKRVLARFLRIQEVMEAVWILETPASKNGDHVREMKEVMRLTADDHHSSEGVGEES